MKDVEEILSELASQGFEGIISPTTEDRLGKRGIHIPKPPKLTLKQSIHLIFSEARKQKALAIAKTLPQSPMAALIGANDRFMPNVEWLSRVHPRLQVTVIPDVDHATAPGHPKFGEALIAFLLKHKTSR